MIDVERWQKITGTIHSVSDLGRVRNDKTGHMLIGVPEKDGYLRVSIRIDGKQKTIKIHRLVATAFLGVSPAGKTQVAHIDGSRTNNAAANLRWSDATENNRDKARHGTQNRGVTHPLAKLDEEKVRCIREMARNGASIRGIARVFQVRKWTIEGVVNRSTWKHVS